MLVEGSLHKNILNSLLFLSYNLTRVFLMKFCKEVEINIIRDEGSPGANKQRKGAKMILHLTCMKICGKYHFRVLISKIYFILENFDIQSCSPLQVSDASCKSKCNIKNVKKETLVALSLVDTVLQA